MTNPTPTPIDDGGNPLEGVIPASKRKMVYAWFAVIALVLSITQAVTLLVNTDGHEPMWLKIVTLVYTLLAASVHAMSGGNVNKITT
jgi:hypothetical protein